MTTPDLVPAANRRVARWLFICCALVFAMVVLGGVTRLTGSGLSMVDWRPVTGWLPPLSDAAWLEEFARYQDSPQFRKTNSHMGVAEFKGQFSGWSTCIACWDASSASPFSYRSCGSPGAATSGDATCRNTV
ncbi:MAG: COX15/CtaA family protein [Woeseiaceae bacterium]|nr:COX15/CtaA family protein [Woeseiaceae bacterium]